ncbi:MAG: serine hydrolase domain-containing protein [Candidatus Methylacidiphilales bacterium]
MTAFISGEAWRHTAAVFQKGIELGQHFGGQLCVMHEGRTVLDAGWGTSGPDGVGIQSDDVMLWMSSGKPVTAVAIARLVEAGLLHWDTPVCEWIPEFGNQGKEAITLANILSQSAALRGADAIDGTNCGEMLRAIYDLPLDQGQIPGRHAGYHVGGTWMILGEVIRRVTGLSIQSYLKKELFPALEMEGCGLGGADQHDGGFMTCPLPIFDTTTTSPRIHPVYGVETAVRLPRPGRNLHGPIRELARFYASLRHILRGGRGILRSETVERMIVPQRPAGMRDLTFGHQADFGFGFYLHPEKYGRGKSSYGYGARASDQSFGHSGAQSSCGFYDPEVDVVVTWVVDGMPGEPKHQRRARALNEALYTDLGI